MFHYSEGTPSHAVATRRKAMGPSISIYMYVVYLCLGQTSIYIGTKLQKHFVFVFSLLRNVGAVHYSPFIRPMNSLFFN